MEITISHNDDNSISVAISGRIDTTTAADFEKAIAPVISAGSTKVFLDCEGFDYVSSTGLRVFLILQKAMLARGGTVIFRQMKPDIRNIFDMTGFSALFQFE